MHTSFWLKNDNILIVPWFFLPLYSMPPDTIESIHIIISYQCCWWHIYASYSLWWFLRYIMACSRQKYCSGRPWFVIKIKINTRIVCFSYSFHSNLIHITLLITTILWLVGRATILKFEIWNLKDRVQYVNYLAIPDERLKVVHFRKMTPNCSRQKLEQFFLSSLIVKWWFWKRKFEIVCKLQKVDVELE